MGVSQGLHQVGQGRSWSQERPEALAPTAATARSVWGLPSCLFYPHQARCLALSCTPHHTCPSALA